MQASREPRELTVASIADARVSIRDVLVGDVWLCSGQSNMDMSMAPFLPWHRGVLDHEREIAAAEHPTLRLFHVLPIPSHHPVRDVHGEWLACSPATVADFSGVAYYFGRMMLRESGVPQGLVLSALGGTAIECWQKHPPFQAESADLEASLPDYVGRALAAARVGGKRPAFPKEPVPNYRLKPGACYSGMLAPLAPLGLRGVLWYQGEANTLRPSGYADALRGLISQFRSDFENAELPFYFVQLANHDRPRFTPASWAELREQQLEVFRTVSHTGMAVAADVGLVDQIHPSDKKTVGERLSRWALADVLGEKLECSGPIAESTRTTAEKLRVRFSHIDGGLAVREGDALSEFTLAGADGVFHPATATIEGGEVEVRSADVQKPVSVRYAWANNPKLTLCNAVGLPASPFQLPRTSAAQVTLDSQVQSALDLLVQRGVVAAGDDLQTKLGAGKSIEGTKVAALLIKLAQCFKPVKTVPEAIALLTQRGVMGSADYWSKNAVAGRLCDVSSVGIMLQRAASRLPIPPPKSLTSRPLEPKNPMALKASYDIVIAGAGIGGCGAAVQAARMGCSVLLIEETDWIGGQAMAAAERWLGETEPGGWLA